MELVDRPTATFARVVPWVRELVRSGPGLLEAFVPGPRALDPRTREVVAVAVADANGSRLTVWVHRSWQAFLGGEPEHSEVAAVLAWARRSAAAGVPADPRPLATRLPADTVRVVRAVVAATELSSLVANSAEGLWARLRGRRREPAPSIEEAAAVLLALPVTVPLVATAGAMRLLTQLAPPVPVVRTRGDDDNLAVHLLRELVPHALGNALVRSAVLAWPGELVVGVRAGAAEATVRLSRAVVEIDDGVADDASVVLEGLGEVLSALGARRLGRELADLEARRG